MHKGSDQSSTGRASAGDTLMANLGAPARNLPDSFVRQHPGASADTRHADTRHAGTRGAFCPGDINSRVLSVCFLAPLCSGPLWPSTVRPRISYSSSSHCFLIPCFLLPLNVPSLNSMASSHAAGSSTTVLLGDSGCQTTPRRRTKSSAQPFAASPVIDLSDREYREMAEETKDVTVGPMPFDDFLARYLPSHKQVPGEKWFRNKSAELRNIGYDEKQFVRSITLTACYSSSVGINVGDFCVDCCYQRHRTLQKPRVR